MKRLTRRELNRATLARQLLLERATIDPVDAIGQLVGLQAQTPQTWYIGLWSRVAGFDAQGRLPPFGSRRTISCT